jgi:hypothetical protein
LVDVRVADPDPLYCFNFEARSGSALEFETWIRIRIKVKNLEILRLKMEPWWAVDAQNEGAEVKNWCPRGSILLAADSHHLNEEHDLDTDPR